MLAPLVNVRPLDFDVCLGDFFDGFFQHSRYIHSNIIHYEYNTLTLIERIGIPFSANTLIYYPTFCKKIREFFSQLDYQISLNLNQIKTYRQKGINAIIESLRLIDEALLKSRIEKSKLDAAANNLIFLYGQKKDIPILKEIKPYYDRLSSTYKNTKTRTYRLTISNVKYWLNYRSNRFGLLKNLYILNEHALLFNYFENTKNTHDALTRTLKFEFIGGVLNTPIFAFRVRCSYKQRGKKYYIDLADNTTYTRLSDVKEKALTYTKSPDVLFIKE